MTHRTYPLNDTQWRFGQVLRQPFDTPNVYDLPTVSEWLPATVPGNVRTDLLALGRIPDPYFAENYKDSLWVEAVDWWYRRDIQLEPLDPNQRAFLICEGIDYLSAIFVNGQEQTRHEGMFSRQTIEITEAFRQGNGQAEISVRLWGSSALPGRHLSPLQHLWQKFAAPLYGSWVGIYPDRTATLKSQMSFGWDFAPPIRTMGLWDEVRVVMTGPLFGRAVRVRSELRTMSSASGRTEMLPPLQGGLRGVELPTDHTALLAPITLTLDLTLDAACSGLVTTTVHLSPANFEGAILGPFQEKLSVSPGVSDYRLQFHLPAVALWQPWDRGFPHLYQVKITFTQADGQPLDELTQRTGFRTVELQDWQFNINGRPEFMRGVNWVPADSLPGRLRRENYEPLLRRVRQSNANLLRVWGGGLREKQAFYDLCDELGLLVWQEFPFACLFLGSYPRDAIYLALVEAEGGAIVRQLGDHPSLVLWCGGNEFSRVRNRPLLRTLARLVEENDGTRPFLPTSPGPSDTHNWYVWHGAAPIAAYQTETAAFLSEFGLQALPHPDTLAAMLPDPSTGWETHQANSLKLQRYAAITNPQGKHYQLSMTNTQLLISASQQAQAIGLQTAIEHMRRRKEQTGGVCLWQFNEPWPAISWAIVDYFGRPKLAYRRLVDWYNPILVCLTFPLGRRWQAGEPFAAEIWVINDTLQPMPNCHLVIKLDHQPIHSQTLTLSAHSAGLVGLLNHQLTTAPQQLDLSLYQQEQLIAQNQYDLTWQDLTRSSLAGRWRRWIADWVMR